MIQRFLRLIDWLNERVGKISGWLIIPLTVLVVYDVVLRYLFDRPTIWVFDINIQILGIIVILSGGYTLLHDGHVGVDALVIYLSPQKRAIIDLITSLFFFFSVGVVMLQAIDEAWFALQTKEVFTSTFAPPIYPFKIIMAVGIILLFLQGVAKFIRDLIKVASKDMKGSQS